MAATASPPAEPDPRSPLATAFPVLATVACILCIPALITHVKARNFAASVLTFSIVIPNVFNIINPLIWSTNNPENWWDGEGLCDVEVKLQLAFSAANVGAVACILRQLAIILDTDRTVLRPSKGQRRHTWVFELCLCVVIPVYLMISHYIVQPSRYYIYSVQGCLLSVDNSWVSIVLIFVWPLLLCVIATGYGALAVYRLVKYRRQFAFILSSSGSSTNKSRFIRLFALSTALLLIYLPLAIFTFRQNLSFTRHPYSWNTVHLPGWSKLIVKVAGQVRGSFDLWLQIITGFFVFPFFGLGQDAKALYWSWWKKLNLDRFKKNKTNASIQVPLVNSHKSTIPDAERKHVISLQQSLSSDLSITLHEDEPLEKIELAPQVGHSVYPRRPPSASIEEARRKTFQEIHKASSQRNPSSFEIWSDEEPRWPMPSSSAIKVKTGSQLMDYMANQQV